MVALRIIVLLAIVALSYGQRGGVRVSEKVKKYFLERRVNSLYERPSVGKMASNSYLDD